MGRRLGDELDTDGDGDFDTPLVFAGGDDEEKPRGLRLVGSAQVASITTRVRAVAPHQVVWNQTVYKPGDEVEVPSHIAADWLRDGWAELAE